jgi:hypothetical protein
LVIFSEKPPPGPHLEIISIEKVPPFQEGKITCSSQFYGNIELFQAVTDPAAGMDYNSPYGKTNRDIPVD